MAMNGPPVAMDEPPVARDGPPVAKKTRSGPSGKSRRSGKPNWDGPGRSGRSNWKAWLPSKNEEEVLQHIYLIYQQLLSSVEPAFLLPRWPSWQWACQRSLVRDGFEGQELRCTVCICHIVTV